MNPLDRIAEERMQEAIRAGEFESLPGLGRPLELEDLAGVPSDLRAGYLLLRGTGFLPEEMQLRRECLRLDDLIARCTDASEASELADRRRALALRYALLMERRGFPDAASSLRGAPGAGQ